MLEMPQQWFGAVCGQNASHTWAPGGVLMPVCQRCTGVYMGAVMAAVLHLWLRPRLTGRFLEAHGAFLLLMVPFGFHWLPQGPVLRTITGLLFGFGVITYLWLPLAANPRRESWRPRREAGLRTRGGSSGAPAYWLGVAAALVLVPSTAAQGGAGAAFCLSALAAGGAIAIAALVTANAGLALTGGWRLALRRFRPAPRA